MSWQVENRAYVGYVAMLLDISCHICYVRYKIDEYDCVYIYIHGYIRIYAHIPFVWYLDVVGCVWK